MSSRAILQARASGSRSLTPVVSRSCVLNTIVVDVIIIVVITVTTTTTIIIIIVVVVKIIVIVVIITVIITVPWPLSSSLLAP